MTTKTSNERFFDAMVRHQVGLMRLEPGLVNRVNRLLNATESDLVAQITRRLSSTRTPKRIELLLKSIRATRATAWADIAEIFSQAVVDVAQAQAPFLVSALVSVAPVVLQVAIPSPARLAQIAKSTPLEGRTVADWVQRQERSDIARIEQQVRIGVTQGQPTRDIARRIVGTQRVKGRDGVTQITRANAKAIARTAINGVANQVNREVYEKNSDILAGELYVATLDARTTLVCAGNDGKVFPVGKGPIPPLHWQCRSLRVATIDGEAIGERPMRNFTEQQLVREFRAREGLRGGLGAGRSDLPRGTKGKFDEFRRRRIRELTGQTPARVTYQEWLKGQSNEFQADILGPARAKLFREGKVKLDKFVNKRGEALTLEQLAANDAAGLKAS